MTAIGRILSSCGRWVARWWVSLTGVSAILYLTLMPDPVPGEPIPMFAGADKVVHAIMFGGLYGMIWVDTIRRRRRWWRRPAAWYGVGVCLFGGLIELLQGWMGLGRGCDVLDWYADGAGVLLAAGVIRLFRRWHQ